MIVGNTPPWAGARLPALVVESAESRIVPQSSRAECDEVEVALG